MGNASVGLLKITKTLVDGLPLPTPPAQQTFYRDSELKGFAVRVTAGGQKSFVVETRVNGRSRRMTLGKYPALTVEGARRLAKELLGKIAAGQDPEAEKAQAKAVAVTLRDAFADYLVARKDLKPRTVYDYKRVMTVAFPDWHRRAMVKISKDMVERRHQKLAADHGEAYANLCMRVLRAVFNFAAGKYEDAQGRSILPENPVRRLSATRAWYRIERRQTLIKPHQIKPWFEAVSGLPDEQGTVRDYLLLCLFTGLRRQEAARLTWDRVDLADRTLTITDTKNRRDHVLPLPDYLVDLLTRRKTAAHSSFVFPGGGAGGYLVEPRKTMAQVTEASGVAFTLHDLRRTFITLAESLDIPAYALKRLLNHKSAHDVTQGYIVADVERLRRPMQHIAEYILKAAGIKPSAAVVGLVRQSGSGDERTFSREL